jgi:hypothetical protein
MYRKAKAPNLFRRWQFEKAREKNLFFLKNNLIFCSNSFKYQNLF